MTPPRHGPELASARIARRAIEFLLIAFFALLLLPFVYFFAGLFVHPAAVIRQLLPSAGSLQRLGLLFGTTLAIAVLAAILSMIVAVLIFAAFHNLPKSLRILLWALASIPLFIPGHFSALAWIQTIGNAGWLTAAAGEMGLNKSILPGALYSLPGCSAVMAIHAYPISLAMLWIGRRGAGAAPLEAASLLLSPARFWRRFILSWLRPWLAIGWLTVFILCLLDYLVPFLLRRPVFTVEIMSAFSVHYDPRQAAALAIPLILVSLVAAGLLATLFSRAPWPAFARRPAALPKLPPQLRGPLYSCAGLIVFAALFAPLITFIKTAGAWANYRTIFISARPQIVATLLWSLVAAVAVLLLSGGLSIIARPAIRSESLPPALRFLRGGIRIAMLALFALPGSVIGMAMIAFWDRPSIWNWMGGFYDSGLMLPLGLVTLLAPIAFAILYIQLSRTPETLIELERLNPRRSGRLGAIHVLPRLFGPAMLAALTVFILAMQEGHASILLVAPGQETLAIRAYTLLHFAPDSLVAGLCLITLAAMLAGVALLLALAALARFVAGKWMPHCALD